MKLTLRTKLIFHAFIVVFATVLMSTLASVYLSLNQIKEQNQSRLQSALFRLDRLINQNLKELEEKYAAFSHKDETTRVMLNCIQQDFFHFPSLPDLFELAPEMGLNRFAFYFPTKFSGPELLQIYFDKKLGGLVKARGKAHLLHLRKGGELQEERIVDPGIYAGIYQPEPTFQLRSDGQFIQIVAHYEYINYVDASEYGSTFAKGRRIGHLILEKPLEEPLPILDRETGVLLNVYNIVGRKVGGALSLNHLNPDGIFSDDVITLSDQRGEMYDSILRPFTYRNKIIGYLSFSLSHSTTRSKLIDTIGALAVIGLFASILGICGAFFVNRGIVFPINGLVQLVRKVASGDLTQTPTQSAAEFLMTDEIGTMTNDLWQMTDRIREVLNEIDGLIQSVASGDLAKRGTEKNYSGAWQELVVGINKVLDAFGDPFNRTSSYIDRISVGDIPQKISEPYKGDFNTIIANLNMLIDATNEATGVAEAIAGGNLAVEVKERSEQDRMMQALNAMTRRLKALIYETETMIQAVRLGKLDIRANPRAFEGGWSDLIVGINDLIDNFSRQLQLQMEELERFKSLLDQSHDVIFVVEATTGRVSDVNRTACQFLGYDKETLLSMTISQIIEQQAAEEIMEIITNRPSAPTMRQPVTTFLKNRAGSVAPVEISIRLVVFAEKSYVVGVARDITERKKAEANLLSEKKKAEMYFDTTAVILLVLNNQGEITKINRKGCYILGHDEQYLLGKNWFENFLPDANRSTERIAFENFTKPQAPFSQSIQVLSREYMILTGDGQEKIIIWNYTLLHDETNSIVGTLSSGEDVTEQRQTEEEKVKLSAQMRKLQKMESLGTLAGGIAHDFNNLLTPILGYTQMLLAEYTLDSRLNRRLNKIQMAASRAKDLVQQILTFAKQTEQPYQPIMLQPLIEEALKLLRATLPASIEITTDISPGLGAIMGDPTQVHQIIMNLCTNAYHAMREKGGLLEVRLEDAEIRRDHEAYYPGLESGKYVRLVISDTGHGMEPKILDRIFEPYFSTKQREGGTGLGLAVVHGLVKQMKGIVTVYSEIGQGTTFHILLPRIMISAGEQLLATSLPPTGNLENILLVDDEELVLDMMKEMLEFLCYQVDARSNAFEALDAFKINPKQYDLVITDMSMPGLSGLALSREIIKLRPDIPVMICTGFSELITDKNIRDQGIKGFIMKPVVSKDLADSVQKALHPA